LHLVVFPPIFFPIVPPLLVSSRRCPSTQNEPGSRFLGAVFFPQPFLFTPFETSLFLIWPNPFAHLRTLPLKGPFQCPAPHLIFMFPLLQRTEKPRPCRGYGFFERLGYGRFSFFLHSVFAPLLKDPPFFVNSEDSSPVSSVFRRLVQCFFCPCFFCVFILFLLAPLARVRCPRQIFLFPSSLCC